MKTILYLTLFFISFTLKAQWEWIKHFSNGNPLYDISFISKDTGYIVGDFGSIIKTTDNGDNWEQLRSFKDEYFRSVFFLNKNLGWVAGLNGVIIKTTDAGNNWELLNTGVKSNLRKIFFINKLKGFACGDSSTLITTNNGGLTWESVNFPIKKDRYVINDIQFPHPDTGYALCHYGYYNSVSNWYLYIYNSYLFKTVDGGVSWDTLKIPVGISKLYSLSCLSTDTIFISSNPSYFSFDGGASWELRDGYKIGDIQIFHNGKAIGIEYDESSLNKSMTYVFYNWNLIKNNSWDWNDQSPISYNITSAYFFDMYSGFIVNDLGQIAKIDDIMWGSWEICHETYSYNISSILFLDNKKGFLAGLYDVIKTDDSWNTIHGLCFSFSYKHNIALANNGELYISASKGEIFKVNKSYDNCEVIKPGYSNNFNFWGISAPDSLLVYASGDSGVIIRSNNKGIDWVQLNSGTNQKIKSIFFINKDTGFYVGDNGVIKKTINQGNNWNDMTVPVSVNFNKIYFINEDMGFCIGENGTILKTYNGGDNWIKLSTNTTEMINDISFKNEYGIAVGYNRTVLETHDYGENWSKVDLYASIGGYFQEVLSCCITDSFVYIGSNCLLRYTPTWLITPIPSTKPDTNKELKLYPNPTGNYIEIALPNVQGRLICTLSTIDGREVSRQDLSEDNRRVSTEGLAPGIYLVRVCNGGRCWSGRLVRR